MKLLFAFVPFVVALPLLIASALWQGRHTERWGEFPELQLYAKRLADVPLQVGPWTGHPGPKVDEETRKYGGMEGDVQITYVNEKTGDHVNIFVVCGRLLDVMKHTPDRCYPAHGFQIDAEPIQTTVTTDAGTKAEFKMAAFARDEKPDAIRVYWTWSSDGNWKAPKDLRDEFQRTKPIYKLYFDHDVQLANQPISEGPSIELIKVLIPKITKVLFPDAETPGPASAAKN
jgi:uncharacterized protein DUF3485